MSAAPWRTLREERGRRRWGRRERAKGWEGRGGREQRDKKKKEEGKVERVGGREKRGETEKKVTVNYSGVNKLLFS